MGLLLDADSDNQARVKTALLGLPDRAAAGF
jgi:hypothetical protein